MRPLGRLLSLTKPSSTVGITREPRFGKDRFVRTQWVHVSKELIAVLFIKLNKCPKKTGLTGITVTTNGWRVRWKCVLCNSTWPPALFLWSLYSPQMDPKTFSVNLKPLSCSFSLKRHVLMSFRKAKKHSWRNHLVSEAQRTSGG